MTPPSDTDCHDRRATLEVLDTTLRDGEQTQGVAFAREEKFTLARNLLTQVGVDRIEVASACVSDGEKEAVRRIVEWADDQCCGEAVEVLGFCDRQRSADWVGETGCRVMNLLAKGSQRHLEGQLRKTREQHLGDIAATAEYCREHGIACNCYPEDWSNGMLEESEYCMWLLARLAELPIQRIMLPDTLGILTPGQSGDFVRRVVEAHPQTHIDFHCHNDYGLATANSLAAAVAGARGIHVTVNGLGERAGNTPLDEFVVALRDLYGLGTGVREESLLDVSMLVASFSGRRLAANKPITGDAVFTQTAGIHADGDKKGELYVTRLRPERFGRTRTYALGKLAGKASLDMNLKRLGLDLTQEQKRLILERIIELGDQKRSLTADDLPFIISDVLKSPADRVIAIEDCVISTTMHVVPTATIKVRYKDQTRQGSATGDGGYDAFMKALRQLLAEFDVQIPQLSDYEVHIPPGGRTDALVETTITWEGGIRTRGVDSDQLKAAVIATEHMLNIAQHGTAFRS